MKSLKLNLILSFIVLLFVFSCKKEGPTETPNPPAQSGYYLYVGGWSGDKVFVIDTDGNVVIDSLQGFMREIWNFVVTQSGRKMYVAAKSGGITSTGAVYVVDLKTHNVCIIFDEVADLYVAPNGTVFIITLYPPNSTSKIGIIDTLCDRVSFFDTLNIRHRYYGNDYQNIVFDVSRNLLYGINNDEKLFAYDYRRKKVTRVYNNVNGFYLLQLMISPDGRYLYAAGGPVFDLERDSVVAGIGGNYLGSLCLSPDSKYLYITDPGKFMIPEPVPSGKIFIFQTGSNSYFGEIDVRPIARPGDAWPITDRIVLLPPHGKIAYVSGWIETLYIIDLVNNKPMKRIDFGGFTTPLAIGRKN